MTRTTRTKTTTRAKRTDRAKRADRADRAKRAKKAKRAGVSGKAGRPGQAIRPGPPGKSSRPARPLRPLPLTPALTWLVDSAYAFPGSCYRATLADAMTTLKLASAAKSGFDDLKEELDVVAGRRLAQPEAGAMILGFVARHRARFYEEVSHALGQGS